MGEHQPLWRKAATHTLHTSFLLKGVIEERLQESLGLLLADNEALLNLAEEPLRMSDIAERLVLSRGGTTKVIDRLEDMGHVIRRPDPDDRRATVVQITDSGRRAMAEARSVVDEVLEATWKRHLTDEEARAVVEVMDRVIREQVSAR